MGQNCGLAAGLKAQVHAVLAKAGVLIAVSDLFGVGGHRRLANVPLGAAYLHRPPVFGGGAPGSQWAVGAHRAEGDRSCPMSSRVHGRLEHHADPRHLAFSRPADDAFLCLEPYVGVWVVFRAMCGSQVPTAPPPNCSVRWWGPGWFGVGQAPAPGWRGRADVGERVVVRHLANPFGSISRGDAIARTFAKTDSVT